MSQKFHMIIVDSADRLSGSSTDFKVSFNPALTAFKKVELSAISMPNTIYNIRAINNIIYFKEGTTNLQAVIPIGSYNATSILPVIGSVMTSASVSTFTYTATYNPATFKLTISSSGSYGLLFASNSLNSAGPILGFNLDTAVATSQVADSSIQLNKPMFYMIDIAEFPIDVKSSNSLDSGTYVFMSTVNSGNLEEFSVLNKYYEISKYASQNLNEMNVKLKLTGNELADLNGADWSMLLTLCYE